MSSSSAKAAATLRVEELGASRPETDAHLAHPYSLRSLKDKRLNRAALGKELGWQHATWPVLLVPMYFISATGRRLVRELLPALAEQDVHVLVLGPGAAELVGGGTARLHADEGSEALFHRALAGADMLLLPGEPQPALLPQALAWRYGTVPLVDGEYSLNGAADDYDPVMESGTSFLARSGTVWGMHAAFVRAMETYRLPYDWRGIQRNAMESDWSR